MEATTKLPIKHFYLIVLGCAVIIFCESLQVLMKVKDPSVYNLWVKTIGEALSFETYVALELGSFCMKVMMPMMLGVYAYITWLKVRIGKLFVFIWTVLLLGGLAYTVTEWALYSGFYYIKILGYLLCIGTMLHLIQVIKEQGCETRGESVGKL